MHVVCIRILLSASICLSTLQKHVGGFVLILKSAWGVLSTLYYWAWGVLSAFKKHVVVFVHVYQNGRGVFCPWGVLSYARKSQLNYKWATWVLNYMYAIYEEVLGSNPQTEQDTLMPNDEYM